MRKGKNSKRREVPMSDRVIEDVKNYIHHYRRIDSKNISYHLFIAPQGNVLSGYSMNEIIKEMAGRVPVLINKTITLHTLRRSIATHLAEKGAGIHFIQEFLGHSEIDTSQLYAIKRKRQMKLS